MQIVDTYYFRLGCNQNKSEKEREKTMSKKPYQSKKTSSNLLPSDPFSCFNPLTFKPLLSDGKARLTYIGYYCDGGGVSARNTIVKPHIRLCFQVQGQTQENPAYIDFIYVTRRGVYTRLGTMLDLMIFSNLGELLVSMGLKKTLPPFSSPAERLVTRMTLDFLKESKGLVFTGVLEDLKTPGMWCMNLNTIKPYIVNGLQVRDDAVKWGDNKVRVKGVGAVEGVNTLYFD